MKKNNPLTIKTLLAGAALMFCVLTAIQIAGCATPNPNAGKTVSTTNPTTGVTTTTTEPEYLPNQTVTSAVNTASQIAPFVPAPYGTLLTGVLALVTAAAGGVAAWKNNQANGLSAQLTSVIQGVESATTDAAGNNVAAVSGSAVKASIASHATAAGVGTQLNAAVQKITT
jgi:hypothetical protein